MKKMILLLFLSTGLNAFAEMDIKDTQGCARDTISRAFKEAAAALPFDSIAKIEMESRVHNPEAWNDIIIMKVTGESGKQVRVQYKIDFVIGLPTAEGVCQTIRNGVKVLE